MGSPHLTFYLQKLKAVTKAEWHLGTLAIPDITNPNTTHRNLVCIIVFFFFQLLPTSHSMQDHSSPIRD